MAKSKVINTVLNLRDNMSGGLLKAARNAKKAGADIDDSMISATRQVVAFKNKAVDGITSFAKTAMGVGVAGVTALTTAFIALDGATEEYRIAQGKLNTAFDAADLSATAARKSYRNFYAILGDTDTATEASQLLAELVENEKDIATWTRIAAGAHGKWGDSLPIEGLIESSNETAKVGEVTGVLADALNWVGIMEDDFNDKLSACGSEAKRNKLIMDTLSSAYEDAATAFYENNKQVINARRNQATLNEVTAKLGDTSALVKNRLWEMFGAATDGTIRPGSALEWLTQKATAFSDWVESVDVSALTTQFDQGFATMRDKASQAFDWMKTNVVPVASAFKDAAKEAFSWAQENVLPKAEALLGKLAGAFEWVAQNMDKVGPVLEGLIKLWAASKIIKFGTDVVNTGNTLWQFGKTVTKVGGTNLTKMLGGVKGGAGKVFDILAIGADKAGTGIVKLGSGLATGLGKFGKTAKNVGATMLPKLLNGVKGGAGKAFDLLALGADKAGTGIVKLGGGFKTALGKLGGFVGTAFKFVAANPIVLGIAAAIAAGVLIWQNWDTIKQYAGQLWEKVKDVFGKIGSWISEKFNGVKDAASGLWTSIKETFGGIKDSIVGAFDSAKETVSGFFSWLDDKIESVPILGSLYSGGKSALSWIGGKLTGNALGTSYWRGGLTRVNERGGEIMNLPSGTQIIPHDISARMAGGPRVTVNVTVAGNVIGNEQYADEMGERIVDKLLRAIENM
nr:MAG TPA: minor tail protein [Caudoviricetes sp.]